MKKEKESTQIYLGKQSVEDEISKICSEYEPRNKEECIRSIKREIESPESDVVEKCEKKKEESKKKFMQQQQSQQQVQQQQQKVRQTHQQQQQQQQQNQQQYQQHQQQQQQKQQKQQQQQQKWEVEEEKECKEERQVCKSEKKLCIRQQESEGASSSSARKECEKKLEQCEIRHVTRKQLKKVLKKLEDGSAISGSFKAVLRGEETSEERSIETSLTVGEMSQKKGQEETEVQMRVSIKSPELRKPYEAKISAIGQLRRPEAKWEKEEILKSHLMSKVIVDGSYGFEEEEPKEIKSTMVVFRSDKQQRFVEESEEYKKCSKDEQQNNKLTKSCRIARHMAASLDKVHAKLSLPQDIAESRLVEFATEATKIYFLPYTTKSNVKSKQQGEAREYEIEAHVDGKGRFLTVDVEGNGESISVKDYPLRWETRDFLPICTSRSFGYKVMQRLTKNSMPSTCHVEPRNIKTFDGKYYNYAINDCEHIVFAEESSRPRIVVSTKKTQQKQIVKLIVDGEKFELELPKETRHSRNTQALIKVNDEKKDEKTLKKEQETEPKETYITKYEDGVYSIYSSKYGVEVLADGERLKVKSHELIFRNRVTGLCGDMNGEKTSDLKTGRQCVLSHSQLTGFSYMLEDGKCRGIPEEKKTELRQEERRCIKDEVKPTKVHEIFGQHLGQKSPTQGSRIHLVELKVNKTCFTKQMIRVCQNSFPREIVPRQAEFVCMTGPEARTMERRVLAGDRCEELDHLPTEFSNTVYEPTQC